MSSNFEHMRDGCAPAHGARLLHDTAATRILEQQLATQLGPDALMRRAGRSIADLALALAPHARSVWIACGPGNNGGDGFEAALHLHRRGKEVCVSCVPRPHGWPQPAEQARQKALAAGVHFATAPPVHYELCIDALFGIGAVRPLESPYTDWISHMNTRSAPVLAVDLPTGLDADHRAGHLGRRREGLAGDVEQRPHLATPLGDYRQAAVGWGARRRRQTVHHLFLEHQGETVERLGLAKPFNQQRRRNVVGQVGHHAARRFPQPCQINLQGVGGQDLQAAVGDGGDLGQCRHGPLVPFDGDHPRGAGLQQRPGKTAGAGADLDGGSLVKGAGGTGDAGRQVEIEKEMLAQGFAGGKTMGGDDLTERRQCRYGLAARSLFTHGGQPFRRQDEVPPPGCRAGPGRCRPSRRRSHGRARGG